MNRNICYVITMAFLGLVVLTVATPVRRSPDLEARRRSAVDRSLVRFGRSYPPQISASDLREAFQRPTRHSNMFLRFGRNQPVTIPSEDLYALLKAYEEDYDNAQQKRSPNFIRFGRDPSFIRFGRSSEYKTDDDVSDNYARIGRARNHFLRFGRGSDESEDFEDAEESRKKRSTTVPDCQDCQS